MIDKFNKELRSVVRNWRLSLNNELHMHNQTLTRAQALVFLSDAPSPLTQKDLARLLIVEEPTVARLLNGLEKQKLVTRQVSLTDRRAKYIHLADQAKPIAANIKNLMQRISKEALAGIPEEKITVATEVLRLISKNLSRGAVKDVTPTSTL